jgi:hypothetical protein
VTSSVFQTHRFQNSEVIGCEEMFHEQLCSSTLLFRRKVAAFCVQNVNASTLDNRLKSNLLSMDFFS